MGHSYEPGCTCSNCKRAEKRQLRRINAADGISTPSSSGWTPRSYGIVAGSEKPVTFREGLGDNEGHTLISDGEKSDREFRRGHNHYGQNREGEGRVDEDRGHYTGPGH